MSTTANQSSAQLLNQKYMYPPSPQEKIIKGKIHNINRLFKRYINFLSVQQDYVTKALYQKMKKTCSNSLCAYMGEQLQQHTNTSLYLEARP